MHVARHNIFDEFRITVGNDSPHNETTTSHGTVEEKNQDVVVVYQRPAGKVLGREDMLLPHIGQKEALETTIEATFYKEKINSSG